MGHLLSEPRIEHEKDSREEKKQIHSILKELANFQKFFIDLSKE